MDAGAIQQILHATQATIRAVLLLDLRIRMAQASFQMVKLTTLTFICIMMDTPDMIILQLPEWTSMLRLMALFVWLPAQHNSLLHLMYGEILRIVPIQQLEARAGLDITRFISFMKDYILTAQQTTT